MDTDNILQSPGVVETAAKVINSDNVVCKCGCKFFRPVFILKRMSALVSPTGKEEIIDIPVYVCDKCGEVAEHFKNNANYKKIIGE